jgi:hypothetical protein
VEHPTRVTTSSSTDTSAAAGDAAAAGKTGETTPKAAGDKPAGEAAGAVKTDPPAGDPPATDKPKDGEVKPGEADGQEPGAVPEKYELTLPEGITLDEPTLKAFVPVLRELGLGNEQASKLAGAYVAVRQAELAAWEARCEANIEACRNDPEIGGPGGSKFEENSDLAHKTFERLTLPQEREKIVAAGLDSDPDFVRIFLRIGQSHRPDSIRGSTQPPPKPAGTAEEEQLRKHFPKSYDAMKKLEEPATR